MSVTPHSTYEDHYHWPSSRDHGSFNFTKAAEEKNGENLIVIKSKELAGIRIENWRRHREHSERYEARYWLSEGTLATKDRATEVM
jgi:phosphatidylserine/phosphatidylglycerophosphate/cardiolipin synthase-like enzyme